MNKDEYILLHWSDGTKIYLKNGNLHREDGPALINTQNNEIIHEAVCKNDYLYEKLYDSEKKDEERIKNINVKFVVGRILQFMYSSDYSLNSPEHPFSFYYLEGKEYSKEAFMALKLEKELSSQNNIKNNKAKI